MARMASLTILLLALGSLTLGGGTYAARAADAVTLKSETITLPPGFTPYPDGPHVSAMNQNCLMCHSASMVLYQPKLSRAVWTKEVDKMIDTFKAPIDKSKVPEIVDYLTALPTQK